MASYTLTVHTGKNRGDGATGHIQATIVGSEGKHGPVSLDKRFRADLQAGSVDEFQVEAAGLGELLYLELDNRESRRSTDWFVRKVVVRNGEGEWVFPHYNWVRKGEFALVYESSAKLSQEEEAHAIKLARRTELDRRRARYIWSVPEVLPGHLSIEQAKELPRNEQFSVTKERDFKSQVEQAMLRTTVGYATSVVRSWSALRDTSKLFRVMPRPDMVDRWEEDWEFGRQALGGVAPSHLKRLDEIPSKFPLTEEVVAGLLDDGVTLESALAARRVYWHDYAILEAVPMFDSGKEKRYCPPAMIAYYRTNAGPLMPIAIQLGQDPATHPLFTPRDTREDWLAAKMYAKCAEGNAHQVEHHAFATHFVVEPFVMGIMRNLSGRHPVYKLMRRHLRYTMAINAEARRELVAPGGIFDMFVATGGPAMGYIELAKHAYAAWEPAHAILPQELARRGTDDTEALPDYPYRDDALPLWNAIHDYIAETLAIYYKSPEAMVGDQELQAFLQELVECGFPGKLQLELPLGDVSKLVELLTVSVFTASVQHAAVNFQQYEHYAYVPNCPLMMRQPPPTEKGRIKEADFAAMLPNRKQCIGQMAVGMVLSSYSREEEFLLDETAYHESYFTEAEPLAAVERFRARLQEVEQGIESRNRRRVVSYPYLLPSKVPCSIAM